MYPSFGVKAASTTAVEQLCAVREVRVDKFGEATTVPAGFET
jgi:hypothetical protein